ncbi:MAG: response regulator transcription factor [Spirochaetales bacterium]|nr:response regulator transcription factor [Spirochaetales bacterium]
MIVFLKSILADIIEEKEQGEKGETSETGKQKTTSFMIIDEHPMTRLGLSAILENEPGFFVETQESDPMNALGRINDVKPEFLVTELAFLHMDGLSFVKVVRKAFPLLPVLVFTVYDECLFAHRALKAGANGYVMKNAPAGTIKAAVKSILNGNIYFSDRIKCRVIEAMSGVEKYPGQHAVDQLNDLEFTAFMLLGKGYRPRQIARKLRLSVNTVEGFRAGIKNKLMFQSSSDLRRYAVEWIHCHRDNLT